MSRKKNTNIIYLSLNLSRDFYYQYQVKGKRTPTSSIVSCAEGMDVIFLLDFSGSMDDDYCLLKTEIANIVQTIITESNNDYRLGMILLRLKQNYCYNKLYKRKKSRYMGSLPADRTS